MKSVFVLSTMLLLLSCNESSNTMNKYVRGESCTCDEQQDADSVFFAAKVQLQEVDDRKIIHYHCADILVGTASISDESGVEHCENLYELECVSPVKGSLALSDSFTYFTEEMKAMRTSSTEARNLFFEALKRKQTEYFEFTVVNKELKAVAKINMQ